MGDSMLVIRESKNFNFNFDFPKYVNKNLKNKI